MLHKVIFYSADEYVDEEYLDEKFNTQNIIQSEEEEDEGVENNANKDNHETTERSLHQHNPAVCCSKYYSSCPQNPKTSLPRGKQFRVQWAGALNTVFERDGF